MSSHTTQGGYVPPKHSQKPLPAPNTTVLVPIRHQEFRRRPHTHATSLHDDHPTSSISHTAFLTTHLPPPSPSLSRHLRPLRTRPRSPSPLHPRRPQTRTRLPPHHQMDPSHPHPRRRRRYPLPRRPPSLVLRPHAVPTHLLHRSARGARLQDQLPRAPLAHHRVRGGHRGATSPVGGAYV